jgi:3-methylcrotonyl-CoA carboxylase alpha subunit/geranyl-CoA carboxylase alpha subunit
LDHAVFRSGNAEVPFLLDYGDAIRQSLADQRAAVPLDVAIAVVMSDAQKSPLACIFQRPVRVQQNAQMQGKTWLASQFTSVKEIQFVQTSQDRFHAQYQGVDWFLADATFAPPEQKDSASSALEILAPFNGKVIAVNVALGQPVITGVTLFVIESMKLEHAVQAQRSGVVAQVLVEVGQQALPKQVLMRFAAEETL